MVRIAGVTLPDRKKVVIGLTSIYGVGRQRALMILAQSKVDTAKRVADLTSGEVARLTKAIGELPVEGTLKKQIAESIKRLKAIGTYRGIRHQQGLPVRGQRTRSNARTKGGKRKTIGAMRKKDLSRVEASQKTSPKKEKNE